MSNGAQCCALEICCPPGAAHKAKLAAAIATATGQTVESVTAMLEWMEHEDLMFAPNSMRDGFQTIAAHARKHPAEPA